jgi:hypothetical protein
MTTAKQIKQLVAPLLERHPEMSLVHSSVIALTPINHFIRGVTIDRTSSAGQCSPNWGVSVLLGKYDTFPMGFGDRLIRPGLSALWSWGDPGLSASLIESVETEALPALRAVSGFREYLSLALPGPQSRVVYSAGYVRCLLALGDLDEARSILRSDERASKHWMPKLDELGIRDALMDEGNQLTSKHRKRIAQFFHEVEAQTVANLKLEAFWEPTPFPIELAP